MLEDILAEQQEQRAQIASLKGNRPAPVAAPSLSAEQLEEQRAAEIADHEYYCPGCGQLYDYAQQCVGRPEAPHPPIEVVSTDELKGDDSTAHTAAPHTDNLG